MTKQSNNHSALVISDWHIGEYESPETTLYQYSFNHVVAQKRVEQLAELFNEFNEQNKVEDAVIFCLGDMINGIIHDEYFKDNLSFSEQISQVSDLIASLICKVKLKKKCFVGLCTDNHSRHTERILYKNESFYNLNELIYKLCDKSVNQQKNIQVPFTYLKKGINTYSQHNTTFLLEHGHHIPVKVNVLRALELRRDLILANLSRRKKKLFDVYIIGHFHKPVYSPEIIINGALLEHTEYTEAKGYILYDPAQAAFTYDDGKIKSLSFLKLN